MFAPPVQKRRSQMESARSEVSAASGHHGNAANRGTARPSLARLAEIPIYPTKVVDNVLRSPGQPLDPAVRQFMESRFQHDFGRVRVHTDPMACESATNVAANAYAVRNHIVFGPGRYAPDTNQGRRLLAHELAHVVQQRGSNEPERLRIGAGGSPMEHEAERAAQQVMVGAHAPALSIRHDALIARDVNSAYRFQQAMCVRRLGGCASSRDAGLPSMEDIETYNKECRGETQYAGDTVTPSGDECALPYGWNSQNQDRIRAIRMEAHLNDAEALVRMFVDKGIIDDGTVQGRLDVILEATQRYPIPGLQTGIEFSDVGFIGDRNPGGEGYRDPHESSRNQVGHFLSAVGLGYGPTKVNAPIPLLGGRIRDAVGAPPTMSDEEVGIRLIVGHEKKADPSIPAPADFKAQFQSATDEDVAAFRKAKAALGTATEIDMKAAEPFLKKIQIDPTQRGNSIQDLRLSLAGLNLGERIRSGEIKSREEAAAWVRQNLLDTTVPS